MKKGILEYGVYNDFYNFNKIWKDKSVYHMWSPRLKKKRCFEANNKLDKYLNEEWIPFYVDKSECLHKGITQHIFQDENQRTFGMKLISRKNLYGIKFRISILEVNATNHYKMIFPYMEDHFRKILNPVIGQ